ncbi:permease [Pseudidiomarina salinarum]|uniref:Permease n=1 Tax=Pseudidiomarina salinarum TaxID=435908 RepID=A0A094IRV9_9GAMM|nr:permease [Pseudidiomarina salinarum]KFZ30415.1 permease [Pseudidiomarina salinarum]RUO68564.1 permease [Pseudidiomarina salinarum]
MSTSFLSAAQFFATTLSELLLLFVLISMLVYWLQDRFPAKRIQAMLSGGSGYFTAAALGSITPFCSCSTLPMLVGMLRARADFGPVMTFLLTSPLLNPVLVALLFTIFGANLTLIYAAGVLVLSLSAGFVLSALHFERFITLPDEQKGCCNASSVGAVEPVKPTLSEYLAGLFKRAMKETRAFLPQLVAAVVVGAWIHGYVPAAFFSQFSQVSGWYLIPAAALLGIPLYVRASTMIPLALSLVGKGMSYGSVVALTIGGAGASLPEMIILKRIFQWPLLLAFIGVVFVTACLTGFAIDLVM